MSVYWDRESVQRFKAGAEAPAVVQTDAEIVEAALEAALNAACASIQEALGVTTGDFADLYFGGPVADLELNVASLRSYLYAQRKAVAGAAA